MQLREQVKLSTRFCVDLKCQLYLLWSKMDMHLYHASLRFFDGYSTALFLFTGRSFRESGGNTL